MTNIAVILNTPYHVETAVSVYCSLEKVTDTSQKLIVLCGDNHGLFEFLTKAKIKWCEGDDAYLHDYDMGIIVSAYPSSRARRSIPFSEHPVIKHFESRRILITHRFNVKPELFENERVLALYSPRSDQNFPYIYQCDIPRARTTSRQERKRLFVVQGKFATKHRDFALLETALSENADIDCNVYVMGASADETPLEDRRIKFLQDCTELEFYSVCERADYILPLIDDQTSNGDYVRTKFSSSYGISFSFGLPVLTHEKMFEIYPVPSIVYSGREDFSIQFRLCATFSNVQYQNLVESYGKTRRNMQNHNVKILSDIIAAGF